MQTNGIRTSERLRHKAGLAWKRGETIEAARLELKALKHMVLEGRAPRGTGSQPGVAHSERRKYFFQHRCNVQMAA